ncbi:glycosyltransferase family 10 domain-containing protein [Blautia sp. HCP28S3_G10]|uniref:glycosyltransferase family 10 domain-containing protein n=1 Tax=Blautia sp. HCP28S3_G10 TaxID=3438908 RepID=UPI003F89528D
MKDMQTIKIKIFDDASNYDFIIDILKRKYIVKHSDDPDYLFYSVKSKDVYKYKCIRIFVTDENLTPDFNICDYGIGFHYINFQDRYIRYPVYMIGNYSYYKGDNYELDLMRALHKHENAEEQLKSKTDFCSFVYSNGLAVDCREHFFNELAKYKEINSGGRYKNNIGGPVENKLNFQRKHKFAIAFENSSGYGYTTEKIVHAFSAGTIPIYWGNPAITKEFNPDSFINCHDFGLTEKGEVDVIKRIIAEIKQIDQNDELYLKMLKTPAFQNLDYVEKQQKALEDFLYHIFDQPVEKAYRRNRFYWGERYERRLCIGDKFYWLCRRVIPIRDKARRLIGRK